MKGQDALPSLAKSTANDDWRDLNPEEQERLLQQLREARSDRAEKKVAKVTQARVANDIEGTLLRLNAKVSDIK